MWGGLFPVKDKSTLSPHPECLFAHHSHTEHTAAREIHSSGLFNKRFVCYPKHSTYPCCSCREHLPHSQAADPERQTLHSESLKIKYLFYQFIPASSSPFLPVQLAVNTHRLNGPDIPTYPILFSLISMMWINTQIYTSSAPRAKGTTRQER